MTALKPLTPRHLERLLVIDSLIRSHTRQTAPLMARRLEVSERTLRSDLSFLKDRFDAPLDFDLKQGYYYTNDQWRLPTIPLSQGELFALTLGARMLQAYAGSAYEEELKSSIQRISERLPEKNLVDLQRLAYERVNFRSGAELLNLDPGIYQTLLEAWQSSRKLWIRYYTATRNEESERIVDPYYLDIYRGTNPYLIAFCNKRQCFRDFRVDRIRECRLLNESFERDSTFDVSAYHQDSFQYERGDRLYNVSIWFAAKAAPFIKERRWHRSQVIDEHDDGSLTLRLEVGGLNDLKRWVLGYGKEALVKSPPELVVMLKEELQTMSQHYDLPKDNGL